MWHNTAWDKPLEKGMYHPLNKEGSTGLVLREYKYFHMHNWLLTSNISTLQITEGSWSDNVSDCF